MGFKKNTHVKKCYSLFGNAITIKKSSILIFSMILLFSIMACALWFVYNYDKGIAKTDNNQLFNPNATENYLTNFMFSSEVCTWECNPKDMSCYVGPDLDRPGHYDSFNLVAHTSMGDIYGIAYCTDPGLCEPGNYDILECYKRGGTWGVPGDSSGTCTVTYNGYQWGYYYWSVTNEGYQTTPKYQRWRGDFRSQAFGKIDMQKTSSWDWTLNNDSYSLQNTKYYVYENQNDAKNQTNAKYSISLDASGYGKCNSDLPANHTYYVRESSKAGEHGKGYKVNNDIGSVLVQPDTTTKVTWSDNSTTTIDQAIFSEFPLKIKKTDAQLLDPGVTEGSVDTFEGAEYEIIYKASKFTNKEDFFNASADKYKRWVISTDAKGEFALSDNYKNNLVEGDEFITYKNHIVATLGTYYIHEIKAPEGYLISDTDYFLSVYEDDNAPDNVNTIFHNNKTGKVVEKILDDQSGQSSVCVLEQVVRGDYKFVKINEKNESLSYIPFKITSKTTGEWHIAVTDKNGLIDTSSSHYPHSLNTNINDALYNEDTNSISDEAKLQYDCGIWFALDKKTKSTADAEDSFGALPFDCYTIEEIEVEKNQKYLPFAVRDFDVSQHNYLIESPAWINTEHPSPEISKTPSVQTGDLLYIIIALSIIAILCYISGLWVYYRKY